MAIKLPIDKGDTILTGKFKNKKEIVKNFGTDINGQPTVNGKKMLTFRIAKLMKKKEESVEVEDIDLTKMTEGIFGNVKVKVINDIKGLLKYKNDIMNYIKGHSNRKFKTANSDKIMGIIDWATSNGVNLELNYADIKKVAKEL